MSDDASQTAIVVMARHGGVARAPPYALDTLRTTEERDGAVVRSGANLLMDALGAVKSG